MPTPQTPGEKKLAADVATYGWHLVHVPEDADGPGFTYTVGLWRSFQHPEVIVVGLPAATAKAILNALGESVRCGARFPAGMETEALLESYPVTFRDVPEGRQWPYFGFARWFYDGGPFPTLQLVYPDRERRWPWQQRVSPGFRAGQPVTGDEDIPAWARDPAD